MSQTPIEPSLMFVMGVVMSGGTLAITGPNPLERSGAPRRYTAVLESSTGTVVAECDGWTLAQTLDQLEAQWREKCPAWPATDHLLSVDGETVGSDDRAWATWGLMRVCERASCKPSRGEK